MAVVSLKAIERTPDRKGGARRMRRDGRVPAIMYGPDDVPQAISLDAKEVDIMFRRHGGSSIILDLEISGEKESHSRALVKEVQRHTVTGQVLHMDLMHVSATRKITVDVPIVLLGESKGVKEGGVMEVILREIQVECLPGDIPDKLEYNVSEMDIGDSVHVRDLSIPGVEILSDPDNVVLSLVPPTVYEEVKEEVAAEEEPELVSKEKEEAEAGAEAKEETKEKEKGKSRE